MLVYQVFFSGGKIGGLVYQSKGCYRGGWRISRDDVRHSGMLMEIGTAPD